MPQWRWVLWLWGATGENRPRATQEECPGKGLVASGRWTSLTKVLNWWARQDSNLQPDRYERSDQTIELKTPKLAWFSDLKFSDLRNSCRFDETGIFRLIDCRPDDGE